MKSITLAIAALCLSFVAHAQSPGCEWVNFATGPANITYVYGSDYDKYGNSFVIGAYSGVTGVLDLDPSANTHNVTGNGLWLAKYDPAGAMLWLAPIEIVMTGPQGGIAVPIVACDSFGDVYITGGVKDVTIDFDYVSSSNIPMGTNGGGDMYLAKYSASGTPLWSFIIGQSANEQGETIICEGSKVYVGGFYGIGTDFDPDTGTYIPVVPITCSAGFIAMYTSSGQFVWQNTMQGINAQAYGNCQVASLGVDDNKDLFATGNFYGTVDFSPAASYDTLRAAQVAGASSPYLVKYDSTGALIFAKLMVNQTGVATCRLSIDNANNIVLGGYFDGIVDFDLGAGVAPDTMTSGAYSDCFIAKYDNSGNYLWHGKFGSPTYDFINDLAIDDNDNILVGGTTRGQIDADMGPGVYNLAVNGNCNGCDDGFVSKYTSAGQLLYGFSISAWANDGNWAVGCFEDRISITGVFSDVMDFDPSAGTMAITPSYINGYNYYHAQYFDSTFVSGISPASAAAPLQVYPNPSSDFIHIENFSAFECYAIVNVTGQTVQTGKQTQTIDVRNLAAGTYLLELTDENGVVARTKFVRD